MSLLGRALVEQLFVSYHTVLCNNVGPYHACCPVINVVLFVGVTIRLGAYYSQSDKSISLSSSSGPIFWSLLSEPESRKPWIEDGGPSGGKGGGVEGGGGGGEYGREDSGGNTDGGIGCHASLSAPGNLQGRIGPAEGLGWS